MEFYAPQLINRIIESGKRTVLSVLCVEYGNITASQIKKHYAFTMNLNCGSSDDLFKIDAGHYDIIFIDGFHEHNQVFRDIVHALDHLQQNGLIIIHDVLPTSEQMQEHFTSNPPTDYPWTGDTWKAFIKARAELPYHSFTIDRDYGYGIIDTSRKKKRSKYAPPLPTDMDQLVYTDLIDHPEWMNIMDDSQLF